MSTPESLGRYQIVRPLGSGAMGDVYLARDPNIDRQLAIKTVRVLAGKPADIEERKLRLLREARAAGRLLHPNVVALFDADEADGVLYLAFEYVPGTDLSERLGAPPELTLREVLCIAREVASALDFAHQAGIVHRDIKPSNIMINTEGVAKVADFGIAKVTDQTELTRTGSVIGSPQYMSPEQVRGESLDGRSDIFSLGVVLYELLCKHRPFGGETLSTLVFEILAKEPPTVDQLRPGLAAELVQLVHSMLAKDRDHRLPSAAHAVAALQQLELQLPADVLDASAAIDGEQATRRMDSSELTPSSDPALVAPAPATSMPPPLPPIPAASASGTASSLSHMRPPEPVGQPLAIDTPGAPLQQQAMSPQLSTGTYAPPSVGRGPLILGVIALLLLAAVAGWLLSRRLSDNAPSDDPTVADRATSTSAASTSAASTSAASTSAASAPSTADDQIAPASEEAPSSGVRSTDSAPIDQPTGAPPVSTETRPLSAPPTSPQAAEPSTQTAAPSPAPVESPVSDAGSGDAVVDEQPVDVEVGDHEVEDAGAGGSAAVQRFDRIARQANQEIDAGRRFQFQVEPEDAIVRVWRRGDARGIVQGTAKRFAADDKDADVVELSDDGDFLVQLVSDGLPSYTLLVHAKAANSSSPRVVRVSMADAARRAAGGPKMMRVERAVAFRGTPADAEVWLDGAKIGLASQWPGARRVRSSENLQLDDGRHQLRIQAPGYKPHEVTLVVGRGGDRIGRVNYRLKLQR